jgi:hypothetical protein
LGSGSDSILVDVYNLPPILTANLQSQDIQYSDGISIVTITATDVLNDTLELQDPEWREDGEAATLISGLPDDLVISPDGCDSALNNRCTWAITGPVQIPEGTYIINFKVRDKDGGETNIAITVNVHPEDATVEFGDNNPVAVRVPDGYENSGPFSLTIPIREAHKDNAEPSGGSSDEPGDINFAEASVLLVPVGPGGNLSPVGPCSSVVSDIGYAARKEVTCGFDNVPVNTYTVQVLVNGGYYTGSGEDVVTIYDPSLGFTTGGGWFYWPGSENLATGYPGDRTNFGYTMKYNKKGNNPRGSLLLIRHLPDGTIYRVKSNALDGLSLGAGNGDGTYGWASFTGKATYKEPSWPEPIGNHEFIAYVEDHNEPGNGTDRFWLEVRDKDGLVIPSMSMSPAGQPAGDDDAVDINGGNIVAPH